MHIKSVIMMVVIAVCLSASASDSIGWRHSVGLDVRPSHTFSSYRDDILRNILDIENARKTKLATSVHLQYGFSFPRDSRQGSIFPDAWQGIGAALNFLGNTKGIGLPVSLYVFQGAPVWKISERFSLYYEWNFGASFGWRPCDGQIARSNLIVGSGVNAYLNIGAGISYRIDDNYSLMAGVDLTHYSNGNTSFPNPGVNMAGLRVGIIRTFGRKTEKLDNAIVFEADTIKRQRKLRFDVTAYGAWRKRVYRGEETPVLLKGHFPVVGLDISPMWQIRKIFRAGGSLDLQWDQSTDLKKHYAFGSSTDDIRFYRPPILRQICVGVSGRAELVMPIFSVNLGIGYNFIGPEETRATYQLANLKVRLTERFFLNIGYQLLNFQKQNNLMLGFGYSF